MMNIQKYTDHINGLSATEKHTLIKDTALALNNLHKRLQKASTREGEAHMNTSRQRSTTLYANTAKISQSYNETADLLKLLMKVAL
jgi:hypothetical protein